MRIVAKIGTASITDADGDSSTATVYVAVGVNAPPTDISLTADQPFAENIAGAIVGTLGASDPDLGDTHTFSVDDPRFEVVGNVLKLKDSIRVDFERESEINLEVTATDLAGLSVSKTMPVSVGDAAELQKSVHTDDWNDYVIEARDGRLKHTINGKLMSETIDRDEKHRAKSGVLALQVHAGPPMTVRFRKIKYEPLESKVDTEADSQKK